MRKPRRETSGWQKPYEDCESSPNDPKQRRCGKTVARCEPCMARMWRERAARNAERATKAL